MPLLIDRDAVLELVARHEAAYRRHHDECPHPLVRPKWAEAVRAAAIICAAVAALPTHTGADDADG